MLTFCSFITQPNMYARGILFGKMKYELGDHAVVRCPETGLEVDIEFKVKGWVGGTYNAIGGYIKDTKSGKNLFELSGLWNAEMFIKDLSTGKKELLFDATSAKPHIPNARPLEEQAPRESQKLWDATNKAIKKARQTPRQRLKKNSAERRQSVERMSGSQSFSRRHHRATKSNWTGSLQPTSTRPRHPRSRLSRSSPSHPYSPVSITPISTPAKHSHRSRAKSYPLKPFPNPHLPTISSTLDKTTVPQLLHHNPRDLHSPQQACKHLCCRLLATNWCEKTRTAMRRPSSMQNHRSITQPPCTNHFLLCDGFLSSSPHFPFPSCDRFLYSNGGE
jgi:hypothetical protein